MVLKQRSSGSICTTWELCECRFLSSFLQQALQVLSDASTPGNRVLEQPLQPLKTTLNVCFSWFFVCLFVLAALGRHCCPRPFSSCGEWWPFFAGRGFLIVVDSLVASMGPRPPGFSSCGIQTYTTLRLLCSLRLLWILLDQGSNPYPLHWQMDS